MATNIPNFWNQLFGGGTTSATNPSTVVASGTGVGGQSAGQKILTNQQLQQLYNQYQSQMMQQSGTATSGTWNIGPAMPGEWRQAYFPSLLQQIMVEHVRPMDKRMFAPIVQQYRQNQSPHATEIENSIIKRMILSEEPLHIERELYMHVWIANMKKGI